MDFTFALVTDIHLGPEAHFGGKLRKLSGRAPELLQRFVERMNHEVRPGLVINLGDDIEDEDHDKDLRRYVQCLGILGNLQADVRHVAGNHDTIHLTSNEILMAWGGRASALSYTFEQGGLKFIVLHTQERKDKDVRLGAEQLAWFEAELTSAALPVMVLMHHAAADQDLRGNRWFEGHANICLVEERKELRRLIEASGKVLAVFNGHLHWNHLDIHGGVPYVTLQSLIENLDADAPGRPAEAHAVVRVQRSRVVVEVCGAETLRYQFERRV